MVNSVSMAILKVILKSIALSLGKEKAMAYVLPENLKQTNLVVGAMLAVGRRHNKMTRSQLGECLRVSERVIEDYETGVKAMPAHYLYAASYVLGLKIEFFFKPLLYPEQFEHLIDR